MPLNNPNIEGNAATATKLQGDQGAAPSYGCRAWVTFNGTNGSIYASGNVQSVVRNAAGDYTVTLTNALPDANYAVLGTCSEAGGTRSGVVSAHVNGSGTSVPPTSSACRISTTYNNVSNDMTRVHLAFFR